MCLVLLRFATARRKSHWSGGAEGGCNDSFCDFVVLGANHRPCAIPFANCFKVVLFSESA